MLKATLIHWWTYVALKIDDCYHFSNFIIIKSRGDFTATSLSEAITARFWELLDDAMEDGIINKEATLQEKVDFISSQFTTEIVFYSLH